MFDLSLKIQYGLGGFKRTKTALFTRSSVMSTVPQEIKVGIVGVGTHFNKKRTGEIHKERDLGTVVMNDGYVDELRDFFAEIRGTGHCRLPDIVQARHVLSIIDQLLIQ